MKSEKQYLREISDLLDAIQHAPDEARKYNMRRHLHGKVYRQKGRYGFKDIDEVRQSVDCMKKGQPDPSKPTRLKRLEWAHVALSQRIETMKGEIRQEKGKESRLSFLKGPYYEAPNQDKEIEKDLDLE